MEKKRKFHYSIVFSFISLIELNSNFTNLTSKKSSVSPEEIFQIYVLLFHLNLFTFMTRLLI